MKALQIGLGPIGTAISRLLLQKPNWTIAGAIDIDPTKQGRDLGEVAGLEQRLGISVYGHLPTFQPHEIDVAFLTTVSTFPEVLPTLEALVQAGINVIASTEELFSPTTAIGNKHWPSIHSLSNTGPQSLVPGSIRALSWTRWFLHSPVCVNKLPVLPSPA